MRERGSSNEDGAEEANLPDDVWHDRTAIPRQLPITLFQASIWANSLLCVIMHIKDVNGKTCILGFYREGQVTLAALERFAPQAEVTIADANENIQTAPKYWLQIGSGWLKNLDKFDVIIKSPAFRPNLNSGQ